jgi:sulfate adenylyltransferase
VRREGGVAVLLTGLPGAGKSTVAELLRTLLEEEGHSVTLLDGDRVRANLSSELGFSRAHRDLNLRRVGFVASEIVRHGGIALCAMIAPYDAARKEFRAVVEPLGTFLLVHVSTPLDVCERRDPKGMYARARQGSIPLFTGISDPYEAPRDAEVLVDTSRQSVEEAARLVLRHLQTLGGLGGGP